MKRNRFRVEQIVAGLKQAEMGAPVADLIRHLGIAEQTFSRWKRRYAGLESEQVRQFKQLQEENAKLKRLVADLSLDKVMLQDVLANQWEGPRSGESLQGIWARRPIQALNDGPAARSAARGPPIGRAVTAIPAPSSASGSPSWPGPASGTATGRFACSSLARAGRWASIWSIACTVKKV